jgi:hypothetical protein
MQDGEYLLKMRLVHPKREGEKKSFASEQVALLLILAEAASDCIKIRKCS